MSTFDKRVKVEQQISEMKKTHT